MKTSTKERLVSIIFIAILLGVVIQLGIALANTIF